MNPELAKNDIAFAFDEIVGGNWMVRDDKTLSIEALIRIYKELLARGPGLFETWLSHLEDFTVRRLDSAVKIQAHARGKLGRAKAGKRKAARVLEELQERRQLRLRPALVHLRGSPPPPGAEAEREERG